MSGRDPRADSDNSSAFLFSCVLLELSCCKPKKGRMVVTTEANREPNTGCKPWTRKRRNISIPKNTSCIISLETQCAERVVPFFLRKRVGLCVQRNELQRLPSRGRRHFPQTPHCRLTSKLCAIFLFGTLF